MLKNIPAWLPYAAPFIVFIVFTSLEPNLIRYYPFVYCVKIMLVLLVIGLLWRDRSFIQFLKGESPAPERVTPYKGDSPAPERVTPKNRVAGILLSIIAGALFSYLWLAIDRYTPHLAILGNRQSFNPLTAIHDPNFRMIFLIVRFIGLVAVVPVIEEVFYRGLVLRIVDDPVDFRRIPVGKFTAISLGANIILFSASHPEWLAAAFFALTMCMLIKFTRNIQSSILAHSITNLLLGIYIIVNQQWQYW